MTTTSLTDANGDTVLVEFTLRGTIDATNGALLYVEDAPLILANLNWATAHEAERGTHATP